MRPFFRRLRHHSGFFLKPLLRFPADLLILSSRELARRIDDRLGMTSAVLSNPVLSAKFHALSAESTEYLLAAPETAPETYHQGLPVPPSELHEGYGPSVEGYLASGKKDSDSMLAILKKNGFELKAGQRVLDFGCSAGRLIRHLAPWAETAEVRGVDISARHIAWAQENLKPFHFANTTTFPHLPFEDNYFDLVYAGSVFTHISDLADAWLLELKRVLKPGGRLYVTVHDDVAIEVLRRKLPDYFLTRLLNEFDRRNPIYGKSGRPFQMFSIQRSAQHAMVFFHRDYLRSRWGREMSILAMESEAYGYQSAVVLAKALRV